MKLFVKLSTTTSLLMFESVVLSVSAPLSDEISAPFNNSPHTNVLAIFRVIVSVFVHHATIDPKSKIAFPFDSTCGTDADTNDVFTGR